MTMKSIVGDLAASIRSNVEAVGLRGRKDITTLAVSRESMDDAGLQAAVLAAESLDSTVNTCIEAALSKEGMGITAAQRAAANSIARLALDPRSGMNAIAQARMPGASKNVPVLSVEQMGVFDAIDGSTLSAEAYDDQAINNALYLSVAYNLFAAKQDSFGEAFFPTIAIDPTMSGITIGTEVTSLYKDAQRTIDGGANRSKFEKVSLAKAIYDNNLLGVDRNRVIPISRAENATLLLTALDNVDPETGETTAPILIGKEVNLLALSQTAASLAKGVMDSTDALDRTVNMKNVIIKIFATIAATPTTEYLRIPVGMLPHSNFTYTTQGEAKDLAMAFDTSEVVINVGTNKQWNGATSAVLAELAAGYKIKLRIKLTGDGNTQYGDIATYANAFEIVSVADAGGNLVTSGADYDAIVAQFADWAIAGVELDAFTTNSNLRATGQLVTIDKYEQVYNVPVRSGITVTMPVGSNGNDDSRLVGQIQTTGFRMSLDAVKTLVDFTTNLDALTNNGAETNIAIMGVGRHHVDAYYSGATLDLAALVDSESSSERSSDIREALIARIRDEVLRAFSQSKVNVAHSMIRGEDAKVGVVIGTSARVKNYLTEGNSDVIELGADFIAKVVSTPNQSVGDNMYITFSDHLGSERNSAVDPISFGNCVWAPTITTDVAVSQGGATSRRFQTHPRFLHIVHLPVMIKLSVTNIETVLGKVTRNTHAIA